MDVLLNLPLFAPLKNIFVLTVTTMMAMIRSLKVMSGPIYTCTNDLSIIVGDATSAFQFVMIDITDF